jgi:DNA helicase IV
MELRMVGRRSLSGSMTLVGDIAQATGPWAPAAWEELVAHLPSRRSWQLAGLTVSYRAPAEVIEVAARVLAAALPGALPPEPVRHTGHSPRVVQATAGGQDLAARVAATVVEEMAAVKGPPGSQDGNVGVLVPDELLSAVHAGLSAADVSFGEVGAGALDVPVSLLALADAKGLEFDAVVVVEPALIVAQSPHGLRALYVALTRCTRRLAIVHAAPLPEAMGLG